MTNTDLPAILHRLRAFKMSKSRYIWLPLLRLNPPTEGLPWDDLRKIFSECQRMANVPNGEQILPKILTGWVGRTNVTDDRRQTDGRATAYSERKREFKIAKI